MNKRLCIVLAALLIAILIPGVILHSQRGILFENAFWKLGKDGAFRSGNNCIRMTGINRFELSFSDQILTAQKSTLPGGGIRMEFSDGWAVERTSEDDFLFDVGAYAWSGDALLIPADLSTSHLYFAAPDHEEHFPFYGEDGETPVGETVFILSADGETLDFYEIWYDHPARSTPEREIIILKEGARLPANISMHNYLVQNERGEYLVDAENLGAIPSGYQSFTRSDLAWFLLRIARGSTQPRGDLSIVALFVLLYIMGAANLLWPEKLAFYGSRWKFRTEPELSDAGYLSIYIGSGFVMLMGVIMLFAAL